MRIALGVEYNGHGYHGWQAQHELETVQGNVQKALSKIANEEIFLHCAGRTDAGVHATGQVVHFDTNAKRHVDAWIYGCNAHLPTSIVIRWAQQVDYSFHARFKATSRRYRYVIYNHPVRPGILHGRVAWHYYALDVTKMQQAASYLIGEQDFSSFRAAKCGSNTPMRNIMKVNVSREGDFVFIDIEANAFLHHMVRNIAGTLMKIGEGQRPVDWMAEVIEAKSRKAAAETAPAGGLYLVQVRYPEVYSFPPGSSPFLL